MPKGSEKLGPELLSELSDEDWKVSPSLEDTQPEPVEAKDKTANRKKKTNKKKKSENKELTEAPIKKQRELVNPFDYILLSSIDDRAFIEPFLPARSTLKNSREEKIFYSMVNAYIGDFDFSELSSSDIESIMTLAMNKVLEERLLKYAARVPIRKDGTVEDTEDNLLEISASIERYRKHNDKIKSDLANTRASRIDPKAKQNFSIVDIVVAFDENKRKDFERRAKKAEKDMENFLAERKNQ